ncbi:MAG: membrane protein insertase YidC [Candidatus Omnitrophica bacterium]|nr:membrane protein insertase YidC [Candidatus Omnitrophota bacterium]MCM8770459.1 membrane protein insertase YidC [Candidatus Omnitrophota bacterium]
MEKRVLFATLLSILVLVIWSVLFRPQQEIVLQPLENKTLTSRNATSLSPFASATTEEIDRGHYKVKFAPHLGGIKEVIFPDYHDYVFCLEGLYFPDLPSSFIKQDGFGQEKTFVYNDSQKRIIQTYNFSNSKYTIELTIRIQNQGDEELKLNLPFILARIYRATGQASRFQFQEGFFFTKDILRLSPWKNTVSAGPVKYLGFRETYFCALLQPLNSSGQGFIKMVDAQQSILGWELNTQVPANKEVMVKFLVYLGPQEPKFLQTADPAWPVIVHYGFFDPISKTLLALLRFFHHLVRNWGLAIIVLSLFIYTILFPLSLKQIQAMKEMQLLQPKIEELRKIYKDNPQKLNKEIMELYRVHKVNPFGGCLPLLLQIPIFFALYQALMRSLELKGAKFLWIKDLSKPDQLFTLPWQLPIIGQEINILPLLMCMIMFLQQKLTSKTTVSAEQQKMMSILFPLLFGLIFYHMPAGLVLYWFLNSTLMFFYQLKISK